MIITKELIKILNESYKARLRLKNRTDKEEVKK